MPPTNVSRLRLLVLATADTPQPAFLEDLSHHEICTPYYSASIPIWRDTLSLTAPTIISFREEWLSSEAREVVQAIGAWLVCFQKPTEKADLEAIRKILTTIHEVIEQHNREGYSTVEPLLLVVGMQQSRIPTREVEGDEWEDLCRECGGWEWIDGTIGQGEDGGMDGRGGEEKNEFGEKVGIPRLKEALEAHEWESGDTADLSDDLDFESEGGFGAEVAQMEREMLGLKMAVHGDEGSEEGGDEGVEELEIMMLRMQAIKDAGADMPEAERRRFTANAVKGVMKKL